MYDIDTHPASILYKNRILFVFGEINEELASRVVPHLLVLDGLGQEPIKLIINSPGGELDAGLAIYDTMNLVRSPIHTICIGHAASLAAWLLAAGDHGRRTATENARIMIHQASTVMGGSYQDLRVNMKEFDRIHRRMVRLLALHTGKSEADVEQALNRDTWMSARQAKEFGIIDQVAASTRIGTEAGSPPGP